MIKPAAFGFIALGAWLPVAAAAEDPKELAATIIRNVCVETLPDFKGAITRAEELQLLRRDSDDIAFNADTKVSLTVTGKQEIFGIEIEPLCVVNVLDHEGKDLFDTAEALATELGTNIEQDGDGSDMEEDGIVWYFDRDDRQVSLTLLEDTAMFIWTSAILSLSTESSP